MTITATETANTQTFVCAYCEVSWSREASRGNPPKWCPSCRRTVSYADRRNALNGRQGKAMAATTAATVKVRDNAITPRQHKAFGTLLQVAKARVPAMLVGPAGSGKTTAGRQVARALELPFTSESCNPQMSKWDLMGFMGANGQYVPGVLRGAFENGGVVLLDEIDASNPQVLVSINMVASTMVGETVTFPDGADVPRHADFVLIAGANTYGDGASDEYVGREQLDAATLDRFAAIEWDYDETLEVHAAGPDAEEWVSFVQRVRKAAAAAGVSLMVTPRASINGAALIRSGMARRTVEEIAVWKGVSKDERRSIKAHM